MLVYSAWAVASRHDFIIFPKSFDFTHWCTCASGACLLIYSLPPAVGKSMSNCFSFGAAFYAKRETVWRIWAGWICMSYPGAPSPIHRVTELADEAQLEPGKTRNGRHGNLIAEAVMQHSCWPFICLGLAFTWPLDGSSPRSRPPCVNPGPRTGVSPFTSSRRSNPVQPQVASYSFNKCQHAPPAAVRGRESRGRNMICFRERRMEKMTSLWRRERGSVFVCLGLR